MGIHEYITDNLQKSFRRVILFKINSIMLSYLWILYRKQSPLSIIIIGVPNTILSFWHQILRTPIFFSVDCGLMLVTLVCVIVVPSVKYTIECHLMMVMDHFSHFLGNYQRNYFLIIQCQDGKYNICDRDRRNLWNLG